SDRRPAASLGAHVGEERVPAERAGDIDLCAGEAVHAGDEPEREELWAGDRRGDREARSCAGIERSAIGAGPAAVVLAGLERARELPVAGIALADDRDAVLVRALAEHDHARASALQ